MKAKKIFINTFRFIGALIALVRGIIVIGMLVIGCITAYLIYTAAQITINQYNESLTWENTSYEIPLAEIEPVLVSNTIDADAVDAAAAWNALDKYLDNLDGQSIPDRDTAQELLEEAVKWQEAYDLKSDSITRLSIYLQLEDAISEAYVTLDTSELQSLSLALYELELEETTRAGQQYMERLKSVTADFKAAKELMTDTILSVGTVEGGIWTIPYMYTRTELTNVLEQIQTMRKFPVFCETADVLSDMASVLNYNKNAREYFEYREFKKTVENVRRYQYTPVSSIYSYSQALAFGCNIQVQEIEGYVVSMDSPVAGIYYNGERLDSNEYVKRGTRLTAVINEIYEPAPDPWQDEESDWYYYE